MLHRSRLLQMLVFVVLACTLGAGPATQPATNTIRLYMGFMIDVPADWTSSGGIAAQGFARRAGAHLSDILHPKGSRPTDMPYATVEQVGYTGFVNPTATQQQQMAQQVADYYATAFNPPSKADRPPMFKSASVSPVSYDPLTRRFTFSVVAKYDMLPNRHIEVSGIFTPTMFCLVAIWSEADYYDANRPAILAMRDSLRTGTPPAPAQVVGVVFKRTAQFGVAAVVLALVAVQVYILLKSRRERRAEEARVLGQIR